MIMQHGQGSYASDANLVFSMIFDGEFRYIACSLHA